MDKALPRAQGDVPTMWPPMGCTGMWTDSRGDLCSEKVDAVP